MPLILCRQSVKFWKSLLTTLFGEREDLRIVDLGVGYGGRLLTFAKYFPTGKYIGFEPNGSIHSRMSQWLHGTLQQILTVDDVCLVNFFLC